MHLNAARLWVSGRLDRLVVGGGAGSVWASGALKDTPSLAGRVGRSAEVGHGEC